jgi:hypothetical protein
VQGRNTSWLSDDDTSASTNCGISYAHGYRAEFFAEAFPNEIPMLGGFLERWLAFGQYPAKPELLGGFFLLAGEKALEMPAILSAPRACCPPNGLPHLSSRVDFSSSPVTSHSIDFPNSRLIPKRFRTAAES